MADDPAARRATGDAPDTLVEAVHHAWAAFIRGEDPGWHAYRSDRRVMHFDTVCGEASDGLAAERTLSG